MHAFSVLVPAVVAPLGSAVLGRGGEARASLVAAVVVAPTFAFHRGLVAACWVAPWVCLAGVMALSELRRVRTARRPTGNDIVIAVASAFLAVSACSLLLSRLGATVGRIGEPIVELTAVHYGVAGYGATLLALCAADVARPPRRRVARVALAATVASPPIIAVGFLTGAALPQVGGAGLLSVGILSTALVTALDARGRTRDRVSNTLLTVAAVSPVAPMALAVLWAAAQHWSVPALDIPTMARVHGSLNAFGFVVCGLLGYRRLRTAVSLEVASCS